MTKLSITLVFALTIVDVHSRAQSQPRQVLNPSGLDSDGTNFSSGNCICTPFYKCYDEDDAMNLNDYVDDRVNIQIDITNRQDDPNTCRDELEICCINLVQPSVSSTTNPSPQRPQTPRPTQAPTANPTPQQSLTPIPTQIPGAGQANSLGDSDLPIHGGPPVAGHGASCGVRNMEGVDFTMTGFTEGQAQYGEFPWMVALLTSNTGFGADMGALNLFVGGGSLIDPQVVLTAAHKPYDNSNRTLTVRIGEWNFRSVSEPIPHQDIPVREVIYHNRFNRDERTYNYALLVLERPAELGETVGTICLPSNTKQNFDGEQCILSGWGKDIFGEEGRYQRILKSVSVNIVGHNQCESALQNTKLGSNYNLHGSFLCAGDQGQDGCTGDGGSPLVCPDPNNPGQYVQAGVVSHGIGCGQRGIPGVYSRTSIALDWIQEKLANILR